MSFSNKTKEVPVKKVNVPEEDSEEETHLEEEKCICKNTYFFIEMTCALCIK